MKEKKIKIELDENMARTLEFIIDEIVKNAEKEKKNKQECVKIMDKLEEITDRLEEKSEIFFDNEKYCTKENLQKLLNLYKQQEDFFESAIKREDNPNKF